MIIIGIAPSGPVTVTCSSFAGGEKCSISSFTGEATVESAAGLELTRMEFLASCVTGAAAGGAAQLDTPPTDTATRVNVIKRQHAMRLRKPDIGRWFRRTSPRERPLLLDDCSIEIEAEV
jgi:hypothetical protein